MRAFPFIHSPFNRFFPKRTKEKKQQKKKKKESRLLACEGRAVKVFGKKILPDRVEIFLSKPEGLDLDGPGPEQAIFAFLFIFCGKIKAINP